MADKQLFLCDMAENGSMKPEGCKQIWSLSGEAFKDIVKSQEAIEKSLENVKVRQ